MGYRVGGSLRRRANVHYRKANWNDFMIDLYSWPAPNGHKVQILVEELAIAYTLIPINITTGAQHEDSYVAINPNRKIPAIVDHAPLDGGPPMTVFETGAILLYLAEKEKRFLPEDLRQRSEVLQWLFWQVGGLGPMMGQAQHFARYASEPVKWTHQSRHFFSEFKLCPFPSLQLVGAAP